MTVRVGFIGTGNIATPHLTNLQQIEHAEVVGLCDVSVDRCEAAINRVNGALNARSRPGEPRVSELSAKTFTSAADMIDAVDPDAVYIAVPPFSHGDLERSVIAAGKHIFVEKPVALTMDLARDIESRIFDAGLISAVGYQSRLQRHSFEGEASSVRPGYRAAARHLLRTASADSMVEGPGNVRRSNRRAGHTYG